MSAELPPTATAPIHPASHEPGDPRRFLLDRGWSMRCVEREDAWLAIERLQPVAAALRSAGSWSLDGAERDFDAETWEYRLEFDDPFIGWPEAGGVRLGFGGLATLATVSLNGEPLLASTNMHLSHAVDVTTRLRSHGNELSMRFEALTPRLAAHRARPRWKVPMLRQQQLRHVRTTLLGRVPGWLPPAAIVGPWKDVWIEQAPALSVSVHSMSCGLLPDGSTGELKLACSIASLAGPVGQVLLVVARDGAERHCELQQGADGTHSASLLWPGVRCWWPHTHGEPSLHDAKLVVHRLDGSLLGNIPLGRVGFRSVQADTSDDGFSLRVNGVDVFCRGACWTPLDVVSPNASREALFAAVAQASAAGLNMLRVCGPMLYESDDFFDACDAHGVLVWQDFMFANMDYPFADAGFVESVEHEATQQLQRWRGHPSLAVICGNSEVEQQAAMWGAPRDAWSSPLFSQTLAALTESSLPDVTYWPSSVHGGALPFQVDAGTSSYYGVGAYMRPLEDAGTSGVRFATECLAFANIPEPNTLERMPGGAASRPPHAQWKQRSPRDTGASWDFDDVRDHYLERLSHHGAAALRRDDPERYLMLGRIASGVAMAAAFSQWRTARGSRCGGALVWLLRDFWPGAGWGLLDDRGGPKACWHLVSPAWASVAVLLTDEGVNGLRLHLVNETAGAIDAVLELSAWRGASRILQAQAPCSLAPREVRAVQAASLLDHFVDLNHAYRFGPLAHDLVCVTLRAGDGSVLSRAYHLPRGLDAPIEGNPGLRATARREGDGRCVVDVEADRVALFVHCHASGHEADSNYLHLVPGEIRRITLAPNAGLRRGAVRIQVNALNAAAPLSLLVPST